MHLLVFNGIESLLKSIWLLNNFKRLRPIHAPIDRSLVACNNCFLQALSIVVDIYMVWESVQASHTNIHIHYKQTSLLIGGSIRQLY